MRLITGPEAVFSLTSFAQLANAFAPAGRQARTHIVEFSADVPNIGERLPE